MGPGDFKNTYNAPLLAVCLFLYINPPALFGQGKFMMGLGFGGRLWSRNAPISWLGLTTLLKLWSMVSRKFEWNRALGNPLPFFLPLYQYQNISPIINGIRLPTTCENRSVKKIYFRTKNRSNRRLVGTIFHHYSPASRYEDSHDMLFSFNPNWQTCVSRLWLSNYNFERRG